jgi:pyruvate kinase
VNERASTSDGPGAGRRTRLVATIGPASAGVLPELVAAGLDVARINLSHGSRADHAAYAASVRSAAEAAGRDVAVLVDLPGPKLRLGDLRTDAVELEAGASVRLTDRPAARDAGGAGQPTERLPVRDPSILANLRSGDRILLADGAAELRVTSPPGPDVRCEVVRGGLVRSGAGVNVPAERLPAGVPDAADTSLMAHLRTLEPDLVGQSFVRSAADVETLRRHLPPGAGLVAKIETRPAVEDIQAVLRAADAVMVARGDLGVELPYEEVPLVQKDLVRAALAAGRPCIVATQMLESMVDAPRPTRAEASDVANAVLDGADAVMLSAETAIGAWPVEALRAAAAICEVADARAVRAGSPAGLAIDTAPAARALAAAAVAMAEADADVAALACVGRSGRTARLLASFRPRVPVVVLTRDARVSRSLALRHGVRHAVIRDPAPPGEHDPAGPVPVSTIVAALRAGVAGWSWPAGRSVVLVTAGADGGSIEDSDAVRLEVLRG